MAQVADYATLKVEAEDMPTLHSVALADLSLFSQPAPGALPQDVADARDWADDAAGVLDVIGWDSPVKAACEVRLARRQTWASAFADAAEAALDPLNVRRLQSCVRLLGQVEAAR